MARVGLQTKSGQAGLDRADQLSTRCKRQQMLTAGSGQHGGNCSNTTSRINSNSLRTDNSIHRTRGGGGKRSSTALGSCCTML